VALSFGFGEELVSIVRTGERVRSSEWRTGVFRTFPECERDFYVSELRSELSTMLVLDLRASQR
jgi:hypothetical protein